MACFSDWIDMPGCEFQILGVGGSSIRFVSKSVLAARVLSTGVIHFEVAVTVDYAGHFARHAFHWVNYSGMRHLCDGLRDIRNGNCSSISTGYDRFFLDIENHQFGVRRGVVVKGCYSSIRDLDSLDRPTEDAIADLVLRDVGSASWTRFGFLTSLVDPPYVDDAISQINEIIRFLEDQGFEP